MKISAARFSATERNSLFQKLRLSKPTIKHGSRLVLSFQPADGPYLARLDPQQLKVWAGPALADLAAEVERAGHSRSDHAEVTLTKHAADPAGASALGLRAQVFGELVRFSLAEMRLKAMSPRGKPPAGPSNAP